MNPTPYNPTAKLDIKVSEVEFRRNAAGPPADGAHLPADGPGPFPTVLDLHGGAWNDKDRHAEEPMDRALAASGVLVVAIDMTLAPEAPYPACVQDANYGVRWLKCESGVVERRPVDDRHLRQLERRPRRRAARDAPARPALQRDPAARGAEARRHGGLRRDALADQRPVRALPEGREDEARRHDQEQQDLLQARGTRSTKATRRRSSSARRTVTLPPLLIMQGALDDNVLPAIQEKFAATYRAAGGDSQIRGLRGLRTRVGREARAADRSRARDGEAVHRTQPDHATPRGVIRALTPNSSGYFGL